MSCVRLRRIAAPSNLRATASRASRGYEGEWLATARTMSWERRQGVQGGRQGTASATGGQNASKDQVVWHLQDEAQQCGQRQQLTRMFVPKPKKAFQSPGVHSLGCAAVMGCLVCRLRGDVLSEAIAKGGEDVAR